MKDIFDGLELLGLGNLNNMAVFEEEKREIAEKKAVPEKNPVQTEKDFIFEKTYTCPLCDNPFKEKTVRSGKLRSTGQDMDLRPKHEGIDTLKYGAVVCPLCGYAAMAREFTHVAPTQLKLIKEKISSSFTGFKAGGEIYTYDEAIARHKLVLANAVIKHGKASERAYICLMLGWLTRGRAEALSPDTADRERVLNSLKEEEKAYLLNAIKGFTVAFSKENFPMCGMDDNTATYLVSALCYLVGQYDESLRWVSRLLVSKSVTGRIKDKARDLKDAIKEAKGGEADG